MSSRSYHRTVKFVCVSIPTLDDHLVTRHPDHIRPRTALAVETGVVDVPDSVLPVESHELPSLERRQEEHTMPVPSLPEKSPAEIAPQELRRRYHRQRYRGRCHGDAAAAEAPLALRRGRRVCKPPDRLDL